MNNSELVSRISGILKGNSKDSRISRRLILKTAQNKAKFLISQKLNDMSLYREMNLYKEVSCVEMIDQNIVSCPIIEFRMCENLKRSKKQIPELIYSRHGSSIKDVTSVDNMYSFSAINPTQYRLNKKRSLQVKQDVYYIQDGYLYLPDSEVMSINILLITTDLYDLEQCSECSKNKCKSAWDFEFICPDKLLEIVIQETIKELSMIKQIQEDVNPNLNPNG